MATPSQVIPTTNTPHFATLLVMALDPEAVGQRIAEARAAKGWTHEQLADAIGAALDPPKRPNLRTVQRWQKGRDPKTGKSWLPRLDTLMTLADVLEVPRSYFVEAGPDEDDGGAWQALVERIDDVAQAQEENTRLLVELLRIVQVDPPTGKAAASE